jgi:hypothetical protein
VGVPGTEGPGAPTSWKLVGTRLDAAPER